MLTAEEWLIRGNKFLPPSPVGETEQYWEKLYLDSFGSEHGASWLSLIILCGLMERNSEKLLKSWMLGSGVREIPNVSVVKDAGLKKVLREIIPYRYWLYEQMETEMHHLNPKDRTVLESKQLAWKQNILKNPPEFGPSIERSTQIDFWIEFEHGDEKGLALFETKYMKDITVKTTYNPIRDQILRMIDAGINEFRVTGRDLKELWIYLLTPSAFKPDGMGPVPASPLRLFPGASSSRLYAYKIREYIKPEILKSLLPHWSDANLLKKIDPELKPVSDQEWRVIANRIGWVTFEGFLKAFGEPSDNSIDQGLLSYFADRGMA